MPPYKKLTYAEKCEIKVLYRRKYFTQEELAEEYGVNQSTISYILNNPTTPRKKIGRLLLINTRYALSIGSMWIATFFALTAIWFLGFDLNEEIENHYEGDFGNY